MEIFHKLRRRGEGVWFWTLAVLSLIPVWAFHYLPTQDGPSHLANALIIKDYGHSAAGFEAFFEIRAEQVPNWTSHLMLAGLMSVVPPLSAEKLLVSAYVLGFAGSFRYFLGSFGDRCRPLAALGLLFVYNRCFWMGFYNYCLSLILVWVIIGYCLRRRGELRWPQGVALLFLFALAYFTHLVGFGLAVLGALGVSILVRPRHWLGPVVVGLAAAPSCWLAMDYFEQTRFFQQGAALRLVRQPVVLFEGGRMEQGVFDQVAAMNAHLFEHHAGPRVPLALFVTTIFLAYLGIALGEHCVRIWFEAPLEATEVLEDDVAAPKVEPPVGWLFPFVLGAVILGFYLLLADSLGSQGPVLAHGGFLKARFAIVPPLVWLACLRESRRLPLRLLLRSLTALVLGVNLFLVARTIAAGNVQLEEYTAGIPAVGRGHKLWSEQSDEGRLVNPLLHAVDYYCLGTDNLNLDNYEALTTHFPVRYRQGLWQGRMEDADVLISWRSPGFIRSGWLEFYAQGRLRIYRRVQ